MSDVREIVRDYLKANGYDGLAYTDGWDGCGCGLDDLIACGEACHMCRPAYRLTWGNCRWRVEEGCPNWETAETCLGCYTIEERGHADE